MTDDDDCLNFFRGLFWAFVIEAGAVGLGVAVWWVLR
jgi:hypothetical protein